MANFDLPLAETPKLTALEQSYAVDDIERELKALFLRLFRELLAGTAYDINVTGAAHLGSFDIIRRAINVDGLALLQGDREEAATRYLYRAWKSRDVNGRGTYFLQTYLQMLFPNLCSVAQMWQDKAEPYPYGLHSKNGINDDWEPNPQTQWLTSRVEIALDLSVESRSILNLTGIIGAILPARLVPQFLWWIRFLASLDITFESFDFQMHKDIDHRFPWCGRVITERRDAVWKLGKNRSTTTWKLKGCRVRGACSASMAATITYSDIPYIGERGRRIDGRWKIPAHGRMCAEFDFHRTG